MMEAGTKMTNGGEEGTGNDAGAEEGGKEEGTKTSDGVGEEEEV
jgi:hypothetical protein